MQQIKKKTRTLVIETTPPFKRIPNYKREIFGGNETQQIPIDGVRKTDRKSESTTKIENNEKRSPQNENDLTDVLLHTMDTK